MEQNNLEVLLKGMNEIVKDYPTEYLTPVTKDHHIGGLSFFPCGDGRLKNDSERNLELSEGGIMFVGSDWGKEDEVKTRKEQDNNENKSPTVIAIKTILKQYGKLDASNIFLTNAIMGLRTGETYGKSNTKHLPIWKQNERKGNFYQQNIKFFKTQLEVVKPKTVIGLGVKVGNFFGDVFGKEELQYVKNFNELDKTMKIPFQHNDINVFVIFHPSFRSVNLKKYPDRAKLEDEFFKGLNRTS